MTACIALLRAVNVAGHKMVPMAVLRDLCTKLGLRDVQSLLQSGNLVFRTDRRTTAQLELLLETEAAKKLHLQTDFFVRDAAQWASLVAQNPFVEEARRDPGRLVVMFLKSAPRPDSVKALQAAIVGREVVHARGRHAYIVYPDGQGRSRLTNALIEKKLDTRCTARNWNTVLKLAALAT